MVDNTPFFPDSSSFWMTVTKKRILHKWECFILSYLVHSSHNQLLNTILYEHQLTKTLYRTSSPSQLVIPQPNHGPVIFPPQHTSFTSCSFSHKSCQSFPQFAGCFPHLQAWWSEHWTLSVCNTKHTWTLVKRQKLRNMNILVAFLNTHKWLLCNLCSNTTGTRVGTGDQTVAKNKFTYSF